MSKKPYPSDVTDDEWAFVAAYLTLMKEDAPQRDQPLRDVFNGLRWIVRTGAQGRMMPNDLPPWHIVYQQAQRWIAAGVFEDMVHDLRVWLRLAKGKKEQPSAAIFDGRTVQSTPESGERAGYDGHKRKKGSKIHIAVDTLGLLLAAHVTPANEQERAQVKELAQAVQEVTQNSVEVAFVDQGYSGPLPEQEAKEAGMELIVIKLPEHMRAGTARFPPGNIRHKQGHRNKFTSRRDGAIPEINPKIVQEQLGHASLNLTLNTYSHVIKSMRGIAANALEEVVGSV